MGKVQRTSLLVVKYWTIEKKLYNFNFALFFSCPAGIQFSDPDVTGGVESKMLTVFLLMFFFNYLCVQNFGIYTTRKVLLEIFPTLLSTPKYFTYRTRAVITRS